MTYKQEVRDGKASSLKIKIKSWFYSSVFAWDIGSFSKSIGRSWAGFWAEEEVWANVSIAQDPDPVLFPSATVWLSYLVNARTARFRTPFYGDKEDTCVLQQVYSLKWRVRNLILYDARWGDLDAIEGTQMANSIWSRWYIPENTSCSWSHEPDPYTQVFCMHKQVFNK